MISDSISDAIPLQMKFFEYCYPFSNGLLSYLPQKNLFVSSQIRVLHLTKYDVTNDVNYFLQYITGHFTLAKGIKTRE